MDRSKKPQPPEGTRNPQASDHEFNSTIMLALKLADYDAHELRKSISDIEDDEEAIASLCLNFRLTEEEAQFVLDHKLRILFALLDAGYEFKAKIKAILDEQPARREQALTSEELEFARNAFRKKIGMDSIDCFIGAVRGAGSLETVEERLYRNFDLTRKEADFVLRIPLHKLTAEWLEGDSGEGEEANVPADATADSKTEFDIVLEDFVVRKKISVIKTVREITGIGLKEAKAAVEDAPSLILEALSKADAEGVKIRLEEAGAVISLR